MLLQLYNLFCTEQQDRARSCDGGKVDSERSQTSNSRGRQSNQQDAVISILSESVLLCPSLTRAKQVVQGLLEVLIGSDL